MTKYDNELDKKKCIYCNKFKWSHPDYNFCPYCGQKLKNVVFISNYSGKKNVTI